MSTYTKDHCLSEKIKIKKSPFQFTSGLLHQTHNKSQEQNWRAPLQRKVSMFLVRASTFMEHSRHRSQQDQIWFM